jgi:hypothetical protein
MACQFWLSFRIMVPIGNRRPELVQAMADAKTKLESINQTLRQVTTLVQSQQRRMSGNSTTRPAVIARLIADTQGFNPLGIMAMRMALKQKAAHARLRGETFGADAIRGLLDKPHIVAAAAHMVAASPDHPWIFKASRMIAEAGVCHRMTGHTSKGCSADGPNILRWFREGWPAHARHDLHRRYMDNLDTRPSARKAFFRRLRRVWGVNYGKLSCRAYIPADVVRDRVS